MAPEVKKDLRIQYNLYKICKQKHKKILIQKQIPCVYCDENIFMKFYKVWDKLMRLSSLRKISWSNNISFTSCSSLLHCSENIIQWLECCNSCLLVLRVVKRLPNIGVSVSCTNIKCLVYTKIKEEFLSIFR